MPLGSQNIFADAGFSSFRPYNPGLFDILTPGTRTNNDFVRSVNHLIKNVKDACSSNDQPREVYLHAYDSVSDARSAIMNSLDWYNRERQYSSLGRKTPDEAYAVMLPTVKLAA